MKVALVLSGQLRHVEQGYKFIKENLMDGYEVDTFIHAWYDPNDIGKKFSAWWNGTLREDIDKLTLELYNPKKYIIEPQKEMDPKNYNADQFEGSYRVWATLSMFYSMKEANKLKKQFERENKFKYDVVVRCRFDFYLGTKIKYELYDYKNTLFYKDDCKHEPGICMNDHFAFSNSEYMDIYSSTFDRIDELYNQYKTPFNPETFLGRNVKVLNNIPAKNISIASCIIRNSDLGNLEIFHS